MSDQELFHDAMALHRRYCDRRDTTHECVGQATLKRGEVCLDCPLCGKGDHYPWRPQLVERAKDILAAAGMSFRSLNRECQTAVLDKLEQVIGGAWDMIVGDGDQYAEDIDIRERLNWANNRANAINVSWIDDRGGFRVGHAVQVPGIDGCFVRDWHSKEVSLLTECSGLKTIRAYPERPIEQP